MELETSAQDMPYSNRELREKWHDLGNDVQQVTRSLELGFKRVQDRQDTANGRVSSLEQWKYTGMGAVTVLSFLVVPLLIWALSVLVSIDGRIQTAIDRALSAYEISQTK